MQPIVCTKPTVSPCRRQAATCSRTECARVTTSTSASERIEVVAATPRPRDFGLQLAELRIVTDEVGLAGVDDQQRRRVVVVKEPRVRLDQSLQVLALHALLVADAA